MLGVGGWDGANLHGTPPLPTGASLILVADSGITLSGSNVTAWADQSGNSNNATQATSGQQGTINNSSVGGNHGVTLSGGQAYTTPLLLSGAKTIAIVFKMSSTPGSGAFYNPLSVKNSTPAFSDLIFSNISAGYAPYTFIDDSVSAASSAGIANALDTNAHGLVITYNGSGNLTAANYTASLDGASQTVAIQAGAAIGRTGSDLFSIGARLSSANAVSDGMHGDICFVGVWPRVLNSTDLATLATYLSTKYGV